MDDGTRNGDERGEGADDASTGQGRIDRLLRAALGRPPDPVGVPGRYVDLRDPKRGGMATVYRATDVELGREVAYKVMDDLGDPERYRRLFAREAEITARLQHPGIVPIFGRVTDGSRCPAYAMGYIEGVDFKALASQGRPLRERLAAFRDACRIVEFAHGRGYAHCDISLKNLMIADDGATHVVDWGLARRVDPTGPRDESAEAIGLPDPFTPGFTPPSVRAGAPKTFATDVYGLGAVLAALAFGVTPQGQPDLDGLKAKTAPKAILAIIGAAMADRSKGLYPTAGALADDVGRYLDGEPVHAYVEPYLRSCSSRSP
jgi:eukaryotic-like serine/threonine-protein kinase